MIQLAALFLLTQGEKNFARESSPNSPAGQYFTRQSFIGKNAYEVAEADLQGTKILAIVRRKDKFFLAWDMTGQSLNAKSVEIPDSVVSRLKEQQIAIKIRQLIVRNTIEPRKHSYRFENQVSEQSFDYVNVWGIASVRDVPFVDIPFTVFGIYVVGKLKPEVGSKAFIDGIHFEVKDNQKNEPTDFADTLRVFQEKVESPFGHYLGIEFRKSQYITDHPNDLACSLATKRSVREKPSSDVPEGVYELFLSGDKSIRYWEYITVKRTVTLEGFVKGVPTRPR